MSRLTIRAILVTVPLLAASTAAAQTTQDLPTNRVQEVQRWTREYAEWKVWFVRWRNRPEQGLFSARPRRQAPSPPAWLHDVCATLLEDEGTLADGCHALREWERDDYAGELVAEQMAQTAAAREAPERSVWWEHVHVDALWPMTQAGSSVYGVLGMHVTMSLTARLGVFIAPGAILVRLPTTDGAQTWSAGTDWGFSYRLFDLRVPGTRRPATVHLNVARVWLVGAGPLPVQSEINLAGFSLTFKQSGTKKPARQGRESLPRGAWSGGDF